MSNEKERTQKISLYLHKMDVDDFDSCIKEKSLNLSEVYDVKNEIGLDGKIYVHESTKKMPEWKELLNKLSVNSINITQNTSNKAVIVFRYKNRFLSVVFGYGKAMLKDSTIERNFGLKVAANLVDPRKIRSLNSMAIEDTVLDSQKQSFVLSSLDKFQIDQNREILKLVSGAPTLETTAKFLVGTDSLTATRKMNIEDIKESIRFYFDAYQREKYKDNGFEWLDNIQRVKDNSLIGTLDSELERNILVKDTSVIIGPNKILDWENITGFLITGMGKSNAEDVSIELDYRKYIRSLQSKSDINILKKLKRDKIIARPDIGEEFVVSSVYEGIVFEIDKNDCRYLICYGEWFEINKNFYSEIRNQVSRVPTCEIQFPPCETGMSEGEYNKMVAKSNEDYFLMDKQNFSSTGYGRSKIEPCDILTKDKKFVHVKFGGSSSTLSHLFAQGVVSARIFSTDDSMRQFINMKVKAEFGRTFIKKSSKQNSNFEIVYSIIDHRNNKEVIDVLPFFSLVNLAKAIENLKSMGYRYSLMKVDISKN